MPNLLELPKPITDAMVRYWASKADYRAVKARGQQHINNRGGYQLVDDCNTVVAGLDFDLAPKDVVEFCKRELYGESMKDDRGEDYSEPYVSPEEWAELIADVAINSMESKQ